MVRRSDGSRKAFLDTDEMVERVWWSYGATIGYYGIKEIPCFVRGTPRRPAGPRVLIRGLRIDRAI